MTAQTQLTQRLANWIANQRNQPLRPEIAHQIQRMMLDHLSGVIAASTSQTGAITARHARQYYAPGKATVFGSTPLSALGAAMVNGTHAHGIETDDGYTPGSYHPSCVVFPAVFAVAQELGSPPERVLMASAIGAEVGCRIAAAAHPATRHRGFHNTAIAGVFSSAAATAVLLELDEHQTANALGIAGSHAAGLFEFLEQSSEVKRFHAGKAARDGISSAMLARDGLTGPTTILEGKAGYFNAYAGAEGEDWDPNYLIDQLGEEWVLSNTYVKPYPCCRHLHGAVDAALHLTKEHSINSDNIAEIKVKTFSIAAGHNDTQIDTIMGAQLSLPFALAVAVTRHHLTYSDFGTEHHRAADLRALMERITVEADPDADAHYPRNGRPATVTIRLASGAEFSHYVQFPYGEPQNPISDASLTEKAQQSAEPLIGEAATRTMLTAIWDFNGLSFLEELNQALPRDGAHDSHLSTSEV